MAGQWEYKEVEVDLDDELRTLNWLGSQGWELVSKSALKTRLPNPRRSSWQDPEYATGTSGFKLLLKRRKPTE
jgi:hypothetical protein